MKTQITIIAVAALILAISAPASYAQTDSCAIKLKSAGMSFEQGEYDGTIALLKGALRECNLDKTEKIEAHKLLILSYFKVDNLEAADNAAADIMKIDPYYKPDKFKDDSKLSALFDKYKPVPMLRIGFTAGFNRTRVDVENYYSIVHNDAEKFSEYNSKTGFQLGVTAEYKAYNRLWVGAGAKFRQSQYEHIIDSVENATVNYNEKLSYIDVPVTIKYYLTEKTINPYVFAGASFSFMTNALGTTERGEQKDIVNRIDYRNTFMFGIHGGAGVTYRIKGMDLFAGLNYVYYPDNVNKEGTRYADLVNVFKYYNLDNDFRMDNWQFNLGIHYSILYKNQKMN
jgi:hypothetical protein